MRSDTSANVSHEDMDRNTVTIEGLPAGLSSRKLILQLEGDCKVSIKHIRKGTDATKIELASEEDCQTFRDNCPKTITFGDVTHNLTLKKPEPASGSLAEGSSVDGEKVTPVVTKLNFDRIFTWTDLDRLPQRKRGILVQPTDVSTPPQDILEYFEDKEQSCGGPLEAIYPMVDGIFLSFKNDKAFEKVWNYRPHRIKGKSVTVYQKCVPESYTHILAIKSDDGMSPEKIKQNLLSCSAKSVMPKSVNKESNCIFKVLYSQEVDKQDVRDIVQKFKKKYPSDAVSFLLKTDCVQIKPFPKDVSSHELRTLFENKKISDAGSVTMIFRNEEKLLVFFSSYEDAAALVTRYKEKTCPLFGSPMKIRPYDPIFVSGSGSLQYAQEMEEYYSVWLGEKDLSGQTVTKPPGPMIVHPVGEDLLHFLSGNKTANSELKSILNGIGDGKITQKGIEIKLCKPDDDNGKFVREIIQEFLSKYSTKSVKVEDERTRCKIQRRMKAVTGQEDVDLRWVDDSLKEVIITGSKALVETLLDRIKAGVDAGSLELNAMQMRWLQATGIFEELFNKHPVIKGAHNNKIRFEGERSDIDAAKKAILDGVETVQQTRFIPLQKICIKFLQGAGKSEKISNIATKILEDAGLQAIFIVESDYPVIVGPVEVHAKAVSVLDERLDVHDRLQLNIVALKEQQDPAWQSAAKLQSEGKIILEMKENHLCIVGFRKYVEQAVKKLSQISQKEGMEFIPMENGAAQYMVDFTYDFVSFCENNSVVHEVVSSGINLRGLKTPVQEAIKIIEQRKQRISRKISRIEEAGALDFLKSSDGKAMLSKAGQKYRAKILYHRRAALWVPDRVCNDGSVMIHRLKITVCQGDLTLDPNEVIVNSITSNFKLSSKQGELSKAIEKYGGRTIQAQLSAQDGVDIRVTNGGTLKCRKIIHACFPTDMKDWDDVVIKVLKKAEGLQASSISFPAIGTGKGRHRIRDVARNMMRIFRKFATNTTVKYLNEIDIVIPNDKKVKEFRDECQKVVSGDGNSTTRSGGASPAISAGPRESISIGSILVSVRRGDITSERNDAIVNSTGHDFDLTNGMVSRAIVAKGGSDIQYQLWSSRNQWIRVTSGGKLKCKKIIHIATSSKDVYSVGHSFMYVLEKAESENCHSISVPALGTGNLGYPVPDVARVMRRTIEEFVGRQPPKHLNKIDIVIFEPPKKQQFVNEFFLTAPVQAHFDTSPGSSNDCVDVEVYSESDSSCDKVLQYITKKIDEALLSTIRHEKIDFLIDEDLQRYEIQFGVKITRSEGLLTIDGGGKEEALNAREVILSNLKDLSALTTQKTSLRVIWQYQDQLGKWQDFEQYAQNQLEQDYKKYLSDRSILRRYTHVGRGIHMNLVDFLGMTVGSTPPKTVIRRVESS